MKKNNVWTVCVGFGLCLFVVGLILCITIPKKIGFPLFILFFGLGIFVAGLIQHERIKNIKKAKKTDEEKFVLPTSPDLIICHKTFNEQMICRYKFENKQTITALCDLIVSCASNYNKQNHTNVSTERVADLLFDRYHNDIATLTLEQINNSLFGLMSYISICCILSSDKSYTQFRNHNDFFNNYEFVVEGISTVDLKIDFLSLMDYSYIDLHLDKLGDTENLEKLNCDLEGILTADELFNETIRRFKQKYKIVNDDFIKVKEEGA